jgi:putative flippase GtrA
VRRSQHPVKEPPIGLCNGLTSLIGNLVIMRVIVHGVHVPVVLANLVAILACSLVNFYVGHQWVFLRTELRRSLL